MNGRPSDQKSAATFDLAFLYAFFAAGFGAVLCLVVRGLIPARFSADSHAIQAFAAGRSNVSIDQSFGAIALIYRELALTDRPDLAALLGYGAAAVAVIAVAWRRRREAVGVAAVALIAVSIFFAVVYLAAYSKDLITSLVVLVLLAVHNRRRSGEVVLLVAMLLYAWQFRHYWLIVAAGYVLFSVVVSRYRDMPRLRAVAFVTLVVWVLVVSTVISQVQGVPADFYRTVVNQSRVVGADATTAVPRFVSLPEPVGGTVNNILTLLSLLVPLPLGQLGGAYYLALALLLGAVWFWFWRALPSAVRDSTTARRAAGLVLALLAAQAVFEPDYGSTVRHLTPMWPLVLLVVWRPARFERAPKTVASKPSSARSRQHGGHRRSTG